MTPLDKQRLLTLCQRPDIQIDLLNEVDSTNRYLQSLAGCDTRICLAESQTQGKGQHGRQWHSPPHKNIYLSCRYVFPVKSPAISGLSLAVSVMLWKILQTSLPDHPIQIKWPNDILCRGQKLAGILIELQSQSDRITAITGIGINVNMLAQDNPSIDQPWTSLQALTGKESDRNRLCATLICRLADTLNQFSHEGVAPFLADWRTADALHDQIIKIQQGTRIFTGMAKGIDHAGRLVLETASGTEYLTSGTVIKA